MFSKGFVLSVGLSLCSTILIYLYVKSRINNLENKVNSLIQIIQTHEQMSQHGSHAQMVGGQCNYEKIVVSDDEEDDDSSDEEESSDEEGEEELEASNQKVDGVALMGHEVEERVGEEEEEEDEEEHRHTGVVDLTSTHMLHDMKEQVVSAEADGLDEMDDLDEDEEDEDDEEETIDYTSMGKVELRLLCEAKGLNVKGKKKHELLEILGQ